MSNTHDRTAGPVEMPPVGLPLSVDGLTSAWLTRAILGPAPAARVRDVEVREVIFGTATKALLSLTYADEQDGAAPPAPTTVCVKGALQDSMRAFGVGMACRTEADFFTRLAPGLGIRLPRIWFAGSDAASDQGIVIMEDLIASRCEFGRPDRTWTPDLVAEALEQQARWHASTWGIVPSDHRWLAVGSTAVRNVTKVLVDPGRRREHFGEVPNRGLPAEFDDPSRLRGAFRALWAREDDRAQSCLSHGDAHLGNTYLDADGRPGFLDWQGVNINRWSDDVAYFVGGALSVDDRRARERDLLRHYLEVLACSGGPEIDMDGAWRSYREHALHGLLWAVTPTAMQPASYVEAMGDRHVAAARDLDTLALLGA